MGMTSFEQSKTWQSSIDLAVEVYRLLKSFPTEEKFAMSQQIRRAVVSVSTNIAEGFGRTGKKEKAQFYNIAYGSLLEVKSLLLLAQKLGYLTQQDVDRLDKDIVSTQKQINAARTAVQAKLA